MILELMGRHAGHLTLQAGLSCGACAILIPEIPFSTDKVAQVLEQRTKAGLTHHLIVVAEGAYPKGGSAFYKQIGPKSVLGGVADHLVTELSGKISTEVRGTVLGHIQRGAPTTHFDRLLAHRFGSHAIELIAAEKWNHVVVAQAGQITAVPLEKVAGKNRFVTAEDPYVNSAQELGISFGV
jgi:6-phosphofructokinase 1